jgi:sugar phosphate isomerase/epimerase
VAELGFHCNRLPHLEERLLNNSLSRGEFYHYPAPDILVLKQALTAYGIAASIHTPLVRPYWYPDPPTWAYLCDADEPNRNLNLALVEWTLGGAVDLGAEYIVVHFPSPGDEAAQALSYKEQEAIARESVGQLAELSRRYGVPIHLEGFGPSPFLNTGFLSQVLSEHENLRYCFDTAHTYISSQRDGFDYYEFAAEMSPYLGSVHLWQTRHIDDYLAYRHIPVHPSQHPKDGWLDVPRVLDLLLGECPDCVVIFESGYHYPKELGNHNLSEGVEWVKDLLKT